MGKIWGHYLDYNIDEHTLSCVKKISLRMGNDSEMQLKFAEGRAMNERKDTSSVLHSSDITGLGGQDSSGENVANAPAIGIPQSANNEAFDLQVPSSQKPEEAGTSNDKDAQTEKDPELNPK